MDMKIEGEIAKIEATQQALRESIEATKGLAADAEQLLQQHKKTLKDRLSDRGVAIAAVHFPASILQGKSFPI